MLRRLAFLPILAGLLLAACGGIAAPTAEPTTPMAAEPTAPMAAEPAATMAAEPSSAASTQATTSDGGAGGTFTLVPDQTTASFTIDEVLLGQPNTVVGTSHDVQGSFSLDLSNPSSAQYGAITINADSFVTDDNRRNGAIRRFILQTNNPDNATVTFQPTSVDGLPASAEMGTAYNVSITGDLTLHGVTQSVTFQGQVTAVSAGEIHGSLSTSVPRAEFDLNIPNVPNVADVQDSVLLQLEFVATQS